MAQAMRAALRLLVRLCAFAFLLVSCHAVVGDYEVVPGGGPDISSSTDICRPGEWTCNREFLLKCTKDGVWETDQACPTASQCDKTAKTCTVCPQAGARRCDGARREFCNNDRSAWTAIETCNAADECSPTGCGPCIAGEIQCSGAESRILQICNANRRWEEVDTCETPTLCARSVSMAMSDQTWTPRCLSPSCDAGSLRCDGSTLYRCRQSKDGEDRIDICASPALCELAAASDVLAGDIRCPTGCSPAGSFRCTDNAVEQCASDLTGWSEPVPCPPNTTCDPETGECGAPCELGMKRCNAGTLEACTAERTWVTDQVCATAALCDRAPLDGSAPHCDTPVCAPHETRCTGALLEVCNDDRTRFVPLTTCATPELCECTQDGSACMGGIDANGCGVPVCMPLDSGELPLRCNPGDRLQVDICNASLNGWDVLEVCGAEEFCYTADRNAPCQVECPAPLLCNGAELLSCAVKGPPVHQADCATPTLCECAVADTCPEFPNGCGVPQCGDTLPQHQCNGSILQTCQVGRGGWDDLDCGDPALCYPGEEPGFTGGYCAICPTAGVVDCNDDASGIRTCAPDRLGYVSEQSCALGCLERPGSSADYCAVCAEGELRCNGTAPGVGRVRECNEDQAGLTDVGAICEHGCLDLGLADQCAACQAGEKRCMGNQLMACNAARTALTAEGPPCAQACINDGIEDYCGECKPGNTQCQDDLLQTCQDDGTLDGTSCTNGCVTVSPTEAVCAPTCRPGSYHCDGAQLQQCNTAGTGWTLVQTCGSAALCDEESQECDDCNPTTTPYGCPGGTLRSCDTHGHWATTDAPNCSGTTLRTCSGGTLTTEECSSAALCSEDANRCDECNAETNPQYSCSAGTLRSCNVSTGRWVSTAGQNCFPAGLYTCNGGTLTGPTACTICDEMNNQCDVCTPGAYSCSAGMLRVCNSTGQGYDPGIACEGTTRRSCSGSTLSSTQCPEMMPTCNAAQTACVSGCTNGQTRCSVNTLQTCVAEEWVSAASPCANGCFGGAGPAAYCGECASGTQCMGSQPQTCTMGKWTNMGMACTGDSPVCVPGTGMCVACTSNANCSGPTPVCLDNVCVGCEDNGDCTDQVCRTSDHTCVPCTATDVSECPPGAPACFNNTCVTCTSNAHCAGQVCDTAAHTCVDCLIDDDCPGERCDTTTNMCVECLTNAHCMPDVEVCDMGVCIAAE